MEFDSINAGARFLAPLIGSLIAVSISLRATFSAVVVLYFLTALFAFLRLP